jgi:hypothetical protein
MTTAAIAFNETAANVQSDLQGLTSIGQNNVTVTLSGNVYTVTFQGALANQYILPLGVDGSLLTSSGLNASAIVATQNAGGNGQDQVQQVTVLGGGGTFTLTFGSQKTTAIPFGANPAMWLSPSRATPTRSSSRGRWPIKSFRT